MAGGEQLEGLTAEGAEGCGRALCPDSLRVGRSSGRKAPPTVWISPVHFGDRRVLTTIMIPRFALTASMTFAALLLSACAHPKARRPEGRSSFTFVSQPEFGGKKPELALATERQPVQAFIEARPIESLATPVYPAAALKSGAGVVLVGARLAVDSAGRVSSISPSPLAISTSGEFAAEFWRAVETAVTGWKFVPAKIRHLEPVSDPGGTFWRATKEEAIEATFDVVFTFSATGEVLPGMGARTPSSAP